MPRRFPILFGGPFVSIVRIGLGENQKFAAGYEAIFGKKKSAAKATAQAKAEKKSEDSARKKKDKKK